MGDLFIWILSFFILIALIVLLVYQVNSLLNLQSLFFFHFSFFWLDDFTDVIVFVCFAHLRMGMDCNSFIILLQLMCLADLEFDYINPYDSSSRINSVVLPEFVVQGILCLFYLLTGHWIMALISAPYLYYNVRL
ncbi:hypothetical protein Gogos_013619 [Gossypium gossypioides]|uniref:Protein cornichon homolog 4-like n=1 Tax=Gossypium gossypioides TaxID=34282 RepID=A0A7J9BW98_GOSGO|nr:hypothetical protein [Gossypium gossypioides]